jgi:hypothetical protein
VVFVVKIMNFGQGNELVSDFVQVDIDDGFATLLAMPETVTSAVLVRKSCALCPARDPGKAAGVVHSEQRQSDLSPLTATETSDHPSKNSELVIKTQISGQCSDQG